MGEVLTDIRFTKTFNHGNDINQKTSAQKYQIKG